MILDLCYVYCAVEGAPAVVLSTPMPEGGAPRAVSLDVATTLVVASVPRHVYSPEALEPKLADLDWVAAAGAAHHAVVDALAEAGAVVLPFRLFTLFSSEEKAVATLSARREAMMRAFDRVRGKQEWVLRIGLPDPAKISAPAQSAPAPSSGTTFLKAKAEARREAASRATRVKEDAAAVYKAVEQLAEAAKTRPIDSGGTLVVDAAFLVRPSRVDAVREAVTKRAERLLHDGCPVSLTGPWPPYSFASMELGND